MALTLPLPEFPETRVYNSVGNQSAVFAIVPGTSDYPTGGYVISALQCRLQRIYAVSIDAQNSTVFTNGWLTDATVPVTIGSNNIPLPATSFNFQVSVLTITIQGGVAGTVAIGISSDANGAALSKTTATNRTGITGVNQTEVANGTNLAGAIWVVTVSGY